MPPPLPCRCPASTALLPLAVMRHTPPRICPLPLPLLPPGVRNHQAKKVLQSMRCGDRAFFYHSNAKPPGIVGVVEVGALRHGFHRGGRWVRCGMGARAGACVTGGGPAVVLGSWAAVGMRDGRGAGLVCATEQPGTICVTWKLPHPSCPASSQIVREAYPDPSQFDASAKYYDASAK